MDSSKSRLARTFAKVLHAHKATGITPEDGFHRKKSSQKIKVDRGIHGDEQKIFDMNEDEEMKTRVALEALLARIFASLSCIKASYAELQLAQSPYDADAIQSSDNKLVSELKVLSELKQCYLKNQLDLFSEKVLISAEIQEQKCVLKTYEIMKRKLESQLQLKESEIISLNAKLNDHRKENRSMEKRLDASGQFSVLNNLHLSGVNSNHFIPVLRHMIRSTRNFVKLMVPEMQAAGWNLDHVTTLIQPRVTFWKHEHKCFAFESFVYREMLENFHHPSFKLPNESITDQNHRRRLFFERFIELKSVKPNDYLTQKPKSTFAKFCSSKYLSLVHPKMESSLFGNLSQRNMVINGEFKLLDSDFFSRFAEMAKRVWLLHCLAFSLDPPAMIFQVAKGCRFSDVFMESVDDSFIGVADFEPVVAFTVAPGFKIGKTVIQSQVYISR